MIQSGGGVWGKELCCLILDKYKHKEQASFLTRWCLWPGKSIAVGKWLASKSFLVCYMAAGVEYKKQGNDMASPLHLKQRNALGIISKFFQLICFYLLRKWPECLMLYFHSLASETANQLYFKTMCFQRQGYLAVDWKGVCFRYSYLLSYLCKLGASKEPYSLC